MEGIVTGRAGEVVCAIAWCCASAKLGWCVHRGGRRNGRFFRRVASECVRRRIFFATLCGGVCDVSRRGLRGVVAEAATPRFLRCRRRRSGGEVVYQVQQGVGRRGDKQGVGRGCAQQSTLAHDVELTEKRVKVMVDVQ